MSEKPGLQTQRTQLSWERSAISFVAVGGVLMFHQSHGPTWSQILLAGLAVALAMLALWLGRIRHGLTVPTAAGAPVVGDPHRAVALIGWGTAVLAFAVAVMVMFD